VERNEAMRRLGGKGGRMGQIDPELEDEDDRFAWRWNGSGSWLLSQRLPRGRGEKVGRDGNERR